MQRTSLAQLIQGFSRQGRQLVRRYAPFAAQIPDRPRSDVMLGLARDLVSTRGEASGVAIATDILRLYRASSTTERHVFLDALAEEFNPDRALLDAAWSSFSTSGWAALAALVQAAEPPRQELFRRLNLAPGGTEALVRMREDLLARRGSDTARIVDHDLSHLLQSWFNRGFLKMAPIRWSSPASLLERVIRYEAVHDIRDWADLRSRLDPPDRRCFGFFHPAMPEEPLIFVEVALTRGVPDSVQALLSPDRAPLDAEDADTAVFYSISNCQPGLRGISFGHFLIKQVANDLKGELSGLDTFVTLSPIPGFMTWLVAENAQLAATVRAVDCPGDPMRDVLLDHAARYLTDAKDADDRPADAVARFHLGNGARLERLNWLADTSAKGLRQSAGMMVNYRYDLPSVEELHEAYADHAAVAVGKPFQQMLRSLGRKASSRTELQEQP